MAATIKDIAREAGVSFSTVSSVLRSPDFAGGRASAATRIRIVEAASRLHYQPNNIGRGLRTGRSNLIAFLSRNFQAAMIMETIIGAENICHRNDLNMILGTYDTPQECHSLLESLLRKRVDGVLFPTAPEIEYQEVFEEFSGRLPMVALFGSFSGSCPGVYVSGSEIGTLSAEYLLGLGHRKILITGSRPETVDAFQSCCLAAGLSPEDLHHDRNSISFEDGKKSMLQLLEKDLPVTAVFAYNDDNAAGILQTAAAQGISVPDRLSVLGVNNSSICNMLCPPLSTIAQPQKEQGEKAMETLLTMISGTHSTGNIVLSPYLIKRSSCGPAPAI